jgi:hypothetical protein
LLTIHRRRHHPERERTREKGRVKFFHSFTQSEREEKEEEEKFDTKLNAFVVSSRERENE